MKYFKFTQWCLQRDIYWTQIDVGDGSWGKRVVEKGSWKEPEVGNF